MDKIIREADKLTPAYRRSMREASWEQDAYNEKMRGSTFNVVSYDQGDLLTSNTYTMSAALSND